MKRADAFPAWLLAAAFCVPLLGLTSPLLEVDDARYAQVPAEMAASGDWVLPTLDGTAYVEKPPLWYWTAAAGYSAFGTQPAVARVMMWLIALLGLAGVWWLGSWLYAPDVGATAAAATASSALWLFLTHNMTLDMPVSVFLLWTTALALRVLHKPEDARWAAPAAWLAAALAFLSKGLIAVLLPGLWVCGLAFLYPKTRRGALKLLSPAGIGLALLVCEPWLQAMAARRPDFLHVFFVEQHFQRYLTSKYNRGAPFWFYLAVLPAGLLPWTAPFLSGLWRVVRRPLSGDARGPALAAWILGVAAFFSTSHSKLATYILPAIPHAALLAAAELEQGALPWAATLSRALGLLLVTAAVAAEFAVSGGLLPASRWPPQGLPPSAAPLTALLAAGLLAALGASLFVAAGRRRPAAALTAGGILAGLFLFAGLRVAAPLFSVKDLALAVRAEAAPADQVWAYDYYPQGLPFYAGRPVDKILIFKGEFHYAQRDPAYAARFGDDADARALPRAGGRTFVAMRAKEVPRFESVAGPAAVESARVFGAWGLVVVKRR